MPEPLSPEQYAYASGAVCPACEGTDLARGRYESTHADTVTRRWGCENRGASRVAVYTLTWYEGLARLTRERLTMGAGKAWSGIPPVAETPRPTGEFHHTQLATWR